MTDKMVSPDDLDAGNQVARHYGGRNMADAILATLANQGIDADSLRPDDLAPFEELHIGGRAATEYLVNKLELKRHHHVLDVGCGIGGAVRYVADKVGCQVSGIDITPEFVQAAVRLTEAVDLHHRTRFDVGSAISMPYDADSFDVVLTIHAAMNIADRASLYQEMARVLKPGGVLALYDVMRKGEGDLRFPVPWADTPAISCLLTPEETEEHLEQVGMEVVLTEDRTSMATAFFRNILSGTAPSDTSVAPKIAMRDALHKLRNTFVNLDRGLIAPVLMLARAPVG